MTIQKRTITLCLLIVCIVSNIQSQVGLNTMQPLGVLHLDGKGNTTINNDSVVNDSDDFIITNNGYVGIGTTKPANKLTIITEGDNTGLQLKNKGSHGKILASDSIGYAMWIASPITLITYLDSKGGKITVNTTNSERYKKITAFYASIDQIKDAYAGDYGWNNTTKQFKVPADGVYRIAINGYFNSTAVGRNSRIYVYVNDEKSDKCGLISINDTGGDTSSYTMTIVDLKKDDIISFYIGAVNYVGVNAVAYYASAGHTYAYIEAL